MPLSLLPASAAAFSPRSGPTIVLDTRVEAWLTQTLKRINRIKRPLNSVPQHHRCLTETLSGPSAIWTLASVMLPKAPASELTKDSNLLVEALYNYQLIHIEAYVVHVDMVSQNEVAFKLTPETIDSLIEYHKEIFSIDTAAATWDWSEKNIQLKKLQEDFVQAVNRYVYRTSARALEGLEDDGAGELLEGRSEEVKNGVMGLFLPLLPPPPRIVDVVAPTHLMYGPPGPIQWYSAPTLVPVPHHLAPNESWRVLGSTPSPTPTSGDSHSSPWSSSPMNDAHLPSPTSTVSNPPYTSAGQYYCTSQPITTTSMPSLPLPSVLAQQCGTAAGAGMGGFAWSYNDIMTPYPIHIS